MGQAPKLVHPQNEDHFERFVRHGARYWMIARLVYPRGVFRFRSIEEAQAARRRVTMQRPPSID
jgi:hypothetical protein